MIANVNTDIDFTYSSINQTRFRRNFVRAVESISGQKQLRRLYQEYVSGPGQADFFDSAIERLQLDVVFDANKLAAVPRTGPVLFVANHPYGVADGIVLTWLARQARPDVKVMANSVLCQAPEAANHLLPVNFDETREAVKTNLETRRTALKLLQQGGAVGVFPGGGVAASEKPLRGPAVDPKWHSFVAKLVRKGNATVVPLHFDGQNSRLFQIASHTSYTLRLALFFRETHRLMGKQMNVSIGKPISSESLAGYEDNKDLLRFLRAQTYALAPESSRRSAELNDIWEREFTYPAHLKF